VPAATESPASVGRTCAGPLEFFRAIVHRTALNPNVKFEVMQTVETLREYLETREQPGLEYLFAAALMESCFAPSKDAEGVYNVLLGKFQSFDRRRQDMTVTTQSLPLTPRAPQLQRLVLLRHQRIGLIRAFHLAQAIDCDGPWTKNEEKEELFLLLMKLITGYVRP
jgi:hypothetical protein